MRIKKSCKTAKTKRTGLSVATALRLSLVEVIDNIIAGAFAGLAVDIVVPTIGAVARLEVGFAILALFAISVYLRSND